MRYALVNGIGETEAIILWDGVSPYEPPAGLRLVPEAQAPAVMAEAPAVPDRVTNFQARAALRRMGLFDTVNDAVRAAGGEAWDAWEYANHVYRTGALVVGMAAQLGLDDPSIDALFRLADGIEA